MCTTPILYHCISNTNITGNAQNRVKVFITCEEIEPVYGKYLYSIRMNPEIQLNKQIDVHFEIHVHVDPTLLIMWYSIHIS